MFTLTSPYNFHLIRLISIQFAYFFGLFVVFFKGMGKAYERSEVARKEAYLAAAADLYDLDYRMQCLDRESAQTVAWIKGF